MKSHGGSNARAASRRPARVSDCQHTRLGRSCFLLEVDLSDTLQRRARGKHRQILGNALAQGLRSSFRQLIEPHRIDDEPLTTSLIYQRQNRTPPRSDIPVTR